MVRKPVPAEYDIDYLVRDAFFSGITNGVIVEVGAARPDFLSISASFRTLGWKVNPEFCAVHRARGHDILEYAVSDTEADDANFFLVDSYGANYMGGTVPFESFSSLGIKGKYAELYEKKQYPTGTETIPVRVRKLVVYWPHIEPDLRRIDVLAVDVEGWELNVIRSLTLKRYRPKVVILENLFDDPEYVSFMDARGYSRWRQLGPNDIYVRRRLQRWQMLRQFIRQTFSRA